MMCIAEWLIRITTVAQQQSTQQQQQQQPAAASLDTSFHFVSNALVVFRLIAHRILRECGSSMTLLEAHFDRQTTGYWKNHGLGKCLSVCVLAVLKLSTLHLWEWGKQVIGG